VKVERQKLGCQYEGERGMGNRSRDMFMDMFMDMYIGG